MWTLKNQTTLTQDAFCDYLDLPPKSHMLIKGITYRYIYGMPSDSSGAPHFPV